MLRWGSFTDRYEQIKSDSSLNADDIADASARFAKSLHLKGEERRSTEMFSHFLQTGMSKLELAPKSVCFGSDGIVNLLTARCVAPTEFAIETLAHELQINNFPLALIHRRPDHTLDIATLFYPHTEVKTAGVLVVLNQIQSISTKQSSQLTLVDSKAG